MNSSFLLGLFFGCFLGPILYFCFQKISLTKSEAEQNKKKDDQWESLFNTHSIFLNQVQKDINIPAHANIREFFVVEESAIMNSLVPRLRYDLSDSILSALNTMEEMGCIQKIPNDSLLYQMEEHFILRLKSFNASKNTRVH